uniref:Uncharacterized protein n=1 Tax=Helianthus annuus TaxID=4232 RepID=A0A251T890_HELAN
MFSKITTGTTWLLAAPDSVQGGVGGLFFNSLTLNLFSLGRLTHFATVSYLGIILQYTYLSIWCLFHGKNMWRVDLFHSSSGHGGDPVVMVVVIT